MKNLRPKIMVLFVTFLLFPGFCTQLFAQTGNRDILRLEGLELVKGVDLNDSERIGTIFAGKVSWKHPKKGWIDIGYWTAVLSHSGTENIEVCNGIGTIKSMTLTINFISGKQLVLGMRDRNGKKLKWDYNYRGKSCRLGGLGCTSCRKAELYACERKKSDIAKVENMELKKMRGSTLPVKKAVLMDGRLCHYFPVIPRVYAKLVLEL